MCNASSLSDYNDARCGRYDHHSSLDGLDSIGADMDGHSVADTDMYYLELRCLRLVRYRSASSLSSDLSSSLITPPLSPPSVLHRAHLYLVNDIILLQGDTVLHSFAWPLHPTTSPRPSLASLSYPYHSKPQHKPPYITKYRHVIILVKLRRFRQREANIHLVHPIDLVAQP